MGFILTFGFLWFLYWAWEQGPGRKKKEKERAEREAKRRGVHRRGAKIVSADDLQKMIDEREHKK